MQLFSQILFPTDFSEASNQAMQYAVQLSRQVSAKLLVLYAYRLIEENPLEGTHMPGVLKEKLEKQAKAKFGALEKAMLMAARIPYQFLSDVGFISDRILVNMKVHQVDLLLLCPSMQPALADSMHHLLMDQAQCAVMFMPPHFVQPNLLQNTLQHQM